MAMKIFITIHATSGLYISLNHNKRFFLLTNEGDTLPISITGNERIFNKDVTCKLLVERTGVFEAIYAPRGGVRNPVVALISAVRALIPQGQMPSHTFEIPLIKRCARDSSNEGLVCKARDGSGAPVVFLVNDPVSVLCNFIFSLFLLYLFEFYLLDKMQALYLK